MVYEVVTALEGAEVLRRAKRFFAERVPMQAAFPEKEGPTLPDASRPGRGRDRAGGGAGAGRHPRARLDAAVRSAGGPVPVDAAVRRGAVRVSDDAPASG